MKIQIIFIISLLTILNYSSSASNSKEFKDGDIIFQNIPSSQSKAIELATHSNFTHVGIIFYKNNKPYVLEAVQPVRYTELSEWIDYGKKDYFVVMRLKNRDSLLSTDIIKQMKQEGEKFIQNDYDI